MSMGTLTQTLNTKRGILWYLKRPLYKLDDLRYAIIHWLERSVRGYSSNDIWNLCDTYTVFILKRLKLFRNQPLNGHPSNVESFEAWLKILDLMIHAFELISNDTVNIDHYEQQQAEIRYGLMLFAKYYQNLWD